MSDDEFFGDDIELDEATIAVLDEQEVSFFPRPAKRRKIEHVDPLETLDLPEFLPEFLPDDTPHIHPDHVRRLADLEEANSELQRQLQAALSTQQTKEGEVSVLRANQQKAARDHANLLAELNNAKESFKTRELQLQRRMKDEIERLKTEFIFKQQEESSRLRAARPRNTPAPKATPAPGPTPRPKPVIPPETPTRIRQSPSKAHRVISSPQGKSRRSFAGFQNAFQDHTPIVRAPPSPPPDVVMEEPAPSPVAVTPSKKSSPRMPVTPRNTPMDNDDDMIVQQPVYEPPQNGNSQKVNTRPVHVQEDDFDGMQPIDWKSELTRRILAHPVIQSLPLSKVLHTLALPQKYPYVLKGVCASLTSALAALANDASSNETLPSFLNLLTHLPCALPGFADALLSDTSLATVLATLVHRLDPAKAVECEPLAKELLPLLESLAWTMSDDVCEQLSPVLDSSVLLALLNPAHPPWLLENATRSLLGYSTHKSLVPILLPISTPISEGEQPPKVLYLERMCLILIDTNRVDACSETTRTNILKHVATLSVCHPDALPVLTSSAILLASLVTYIGWLCSGLWEDSPELIDNPSLTSERIQTLSQAVFLLHHFVFSNTPVVDIRRKLLSAPPRPFTCTHHIFIVSFGRLSFADPPIWILNEDKVVLESISEIARDLLDLVMDGPEQDSVWAAYQEDPDEGQMDIEEALMDDTEGS